MSLLIETLRSRKTPWEIFQEVYARSPQCFFLDSPQYAPPDQVYSYLGMDSELEIRLKRGILSVRGAFRGDFTGARTIEVLRDLLRKYAIREPARHPFFTGGFVGYFGYETADLCDKIRFRSKPSPAMPQIYLGLFRQVIVYDHRKRVYFLVAHARQRAVARQVIRKMKCFFEETIPRRRSFRMKKFSAEMTKPEFKTMVKKAKDYIAAGDIYQANLSQRFSFDYEGSSLELYGKLRQINPSPFSCFLKAGDLEVVSASPERLIRKKGRLCETRPIAGTCPAKGSRRQLRAWRKKLLANDKERAEHLMLVDLERNDLGRVCDYRSVKVEEFMTLERYSHVVHLVSKVTGKLQPGKDAWDVLRAIFPGGTITGCPKIRCMEIIDELEPVRRGLYTGSLGYIDLHGNMDLNIVIRTILLQRGKGHLQVGAGIVYDSDPEKEYRETLHKAKALVLALWQAGR